MTKTIMVPILMTEDSGAAMGSGVYSVDLKKGVSYQVEKKVAEMLYKMNVAVPQTTPSTHLEVLHVNENKNIHCMAPSHPATITS